MAEQARSNEGTKARSGPRWRVRCRRVDPNRYELIYGRGGALLRADVRRFKRGWELVGGVAPEDLAPGTLASVKAAWGDWARRHYLATKSLRRLQESALAPACPPGGQDRPPEPTKPPEPLEATEAVQPAHLTALDALDLVVGWARRNHRDLGVSPWSDAVRVLERERSHPRPGVCRYCGCTQLAACLVREGKREWTCYWVDQANTICSAPACVQRGIQDGALEGERTER